MLINKRLPILASLAILLANTGIAQDQTKFILTLNDSLVTNMKSLGSLNAAVPANAIGNVAVVEIKYADSAGEAEVVGSVNKVADNACFIELTDDLINSAKEKILRFEVPTDSKFAKVFLNYPSANKGSSIVTNQGNTGSAISSGSNTQQAPNFNSVTQLNDFPGETPSHFVILGGNRSLEGKMEITDKLNFKTKFGEVGIGVDQIKGIRFHVDSQDSAVIVLKNGDTVTGIPDLDSINITTPWGRAEVETKFVEAVVTSKNSRFQPNNSNGGPRWILYD